MTHQAPIAPGEPPLWTLERMDLFIRTLQRTGNVAAAARAAEMSRNATYKLRARLRGMRSTGPGKRRSRRPRGFGGCSARTTAPRRGDRG